jgi:methionine sulfoxide reductase heme-binding subunit
MRAYAVRKYLPVLLLCGMLPAFPILAAEVAGSALPWAWYLSRTSGLIAFALLYSVIFFGLTIRLPGVRAIVNPALSLSFHQTLSYGAIIFGVLHGFALLFDTYVPFSVADVLIPFHATYKPGWVALGIVALYGIILLVLTSVWRMRMPYRIWRAIHYINIAAYIAAVIHALVLGTDLAAWPYRQLFIVANVVLVFLALWHAALKISTAAKYRAKTGI